MQGFKYDKAKELLRVSDEYQVEAMIAVGRPGRKDDLPLALQEQEFLQAGRKWKRSHSRVGSGCEQRYAVSHGGIRSLSFASFAGVSSVFIA